MKKILAFGIVLIILLTGSCAFAADMGVVVIGGDETEVTPVSLDDIQINQAAEMPGYAKLTPTLFNYTSEFTYYYDMEDSYVTHDYRYFGRTDKYTTGNTAKYAALYISLLNLTIDKKDYISEVSNIIFTYDDKYQYGGWIYQIDPDHDRSIVMLNGLQYPINPMYEGYYLIGGALPNAVVDDEKPLRLTFNLGENEITYNIRK